jgi:inner membrane protein
MRHSVTARLVVMGGLAVVLLIPLMWVYATVSERASRRDAAAAEISQTWGGPQVVGGPVLAVPYETIWTDGSGRVQRSVQHAFLLPRDLQIDARLATETRRRGIFKVPVYRATMRVVGTFVRPDLQFLKPAADRVDWDRATLQLGVTDPRGIVRRSVVTWRGQQLPLSGGAIDTGLFRSGLTTALPSLVDVTPNAELPFELTLEFNGTRDFHLLPTAQETRVSLTSTWPHPSFSGAPLPEAREVTASGFTARWNVQEFGRPYPAHWSTVDMKRDQLAAQAQASAFGVSLVQPVDVYQQAERAVKYALLFIVLTFLLFFLWEVFSATLLHPMQYTFVGFAICVFYLLLVSISEHTGFDIAYTVSSTVTILLIAGYARAVLGGLRAAASVFAALATLYGFLYLLLRLEDYALLAGSIGLFIILSLVMFITRRMDWYEIKLGQSQPGRDG